MLFQEKEGELKNRMGNMLVSKKWVGEDNWSGGTGTGYYPSNLKHEDLIKRLLMYQFGNPDKADIPLGDVWAYPDLQATTESPKSVGVGSMRTRTPHH